MMKLIAQRPVLYQGRSYRRGDALPLDNAAMAEAWLKAKSARWMESVHEPVPREGGGESRREAERQAAQALAGLGVEIVDGEGHFVGEERLKEQLCSAVQDLLPDYEDVLPPEELSGGALPEEQEKPIVEVGPDGHSLKEDLLKLSKAELLELADGLKADTGKCKTKADLVEALAVIGMEDQLNCGTVPEEPA